MTISDYFEPVDRPQFSSDLISEEDSLCSQLTYGFDAKEDDLIGDFQLAIIGIEDGRNAVGNQGVEYASDKIRNYLCTLRKTTRHLNVIDLGNIKGATINDKYFALKEVLRCLLKYQVVGLIIGGAQDYLLPIVQSVKDIEDELAISLIDSRLDFEVRNSDFSSKTILSYLQSEFAKSIFELNVLGVQKYFVSESQELKMNDLGWEYVRLGDIRNENIKYTEPYLRDADIVGFDVGAIQSSYMPYYNHLNVNGLTGYEVCQMSWYSGMSDNLKFFCLQEYNPVIDVEGKGAVLCSQIIWHLLEGLSLKQTENPGIESENYKIFVVHLHNFSEDIRFYNNRVNERWWIEVPWKDSVRLLACSKKEYEQTQMGNLPDKWWRFFKKGSVN